MKVRDHNISSHADVLYIFFSKILILMLSISLSPLFEYEHAVTDYTFLQFFQQYGEVVDSIVLLDRRTKRSRGFGFVTFADEVSPKYETRRSDPHTFFV